MSRKATLYDILGLRPSATIEQIKIAFRRLALAHHPDRNFNSEESTARFRVLRNAYDVLSDAARRLEYDEFLGCRGAPESGAGSRLAGRTDDVAAVLNHLSYVLWDIEDLIRREPDWTLELEGASLQWHVETMLRTIDRWVLTPAGFPAHSPFVRVSDYFYHVRLRVDKLFQCAKLSDLLQPIPDTDLRLIDSILEAHNYCVRCLSQLKSSGLTTES